MHTGSVGAINTSINHLIKLITVWTFSLVWPLVRFEFDTPGLNRDFHHVCICSRSFRQLSESRDRFCIPSVDCCRYWMSPNYIHKLLACICVVYSQARECAINSVKLGAKMKLHCCVCSVSVLERVRERERERDRQWERKERDNGGDRGKVNKS